VREVLNIWPPFPIKTASRSLFLGDNVIAALEHRDRIRNIYIYIFLLGMRPLERLVTVMQEQFPALEHVVLAWTDGERGAAPQPIQS
jgi:hypothetical protein